MKKTIEKYVAKGTRVHVCDNIISYEVKAEDLRKVCSRLYKRKKLPLKTIVASDNREEDHSFIIRYVFGVPQKNIFLSPFIRLVHADEFPSLIKIIHEASNYEREIKTFFGLNPIGHVDSRMTGLHENWPSDVYPLRKDFLWSTRPKTSLGEYIFKTYGGEGVYEVPVGPIHAGIIEPGHFRFSVAGEEMMALEPRLGYTHKGSEKLFETLSLSQKISLSERISGDSSYSHSLAFCQALESLAAVTVSVRVKYLRVVYAEMERLANHIGDIGAILGDTGYNVGKSRGSCLREMIMQWNERLTGSRFLRGVNIPGGVARDTMDTCREDFVRFLVQLEKDFRILIQTIHHNASILERLQMTGKLEKQIAEDHGVLGIAAKAVGVSADARIDYPYAAYSDMPVDISVRTTGDVSARFEVRIMEVFNSLKIILHALKEIPPVGEAIPKILLKKESSALGIVEGWRGDIVYFVSTDKRGDISRVKVRDPSFMNWSVFPYVIKNNVILDFPLINKSFNLSYSGNDL